MGFAGGAPAYQICRRGLGGVFCGSLWVSQAGRLRTRFVVEGGGGCFFSVFAYLGC